MISRNKIEYYCTKVTQAFLYPRATFLRSKGVVVSTLINLDKPWLHRLQIDTCIDIGANVGRFSKTMQYLVPGCKIYAFEPLPECFKELTGMMKDYKHFEAFNYGLGSTVESRQIFSNSHNPSSSFLNLGDEHTKAFPFAQEAQSSSVEVKTLDSVFDSAIADRNIFVKIDVQGFEKQVVEGGVETLKKSSVIFVELSFLELYKNQAVFDEMYNSIVDLGFTFFGHVGVMNSPHTGLALDADCVFIRNDLIHKITGD